jgi:polyisoprenoid-binding protein YceI
MTSMRSALVLGALTLFSAAAQAEATPWTIDANHSQTTFVVPHMMVSEVEGQFREIKGDVKLDEKNLTKSSVEITIPAASMDTGNADRDKHLKSAEFFDVTKFPNIVFKSSKIAKAGNAYKLTGDLTIHGVTKPITVDGTISEPVKNPWGKQVRAVKINGKLNRRDYGLTWNKSLDKGGVLVGDEVTLNIRLELNK